MKSSNWWDFLSHCAGQGWEEQEAIWHWPHVVGERLSKLARPLYVDRGILHLAVPTPLVANELRLWSREILARLASVAPRSGVRELRFHIVPEGQRPREEKVLASQEELNRAERMIPQTLPSPLRQKFVNILAQALAQEAAILSEGGRHCKKCSVVFIGPGEECPLCRLIL